MKLGSDFFFSNFHRMGAHKKRENDPTAQDFEIEKIIMHYSYKKPYGLSHDIALLKLSSPAQLNSVVGIACLPDTSVDLPIDDESKKCWITGIQYQGFSIKFSTRFMQFYNG